MHFRQRVVGRLGRTLDVPTTLDRATRYHLRHHDTNILLTPLQAGAGLRTFAPNW